MTVVVTSSGASRGAPRSPRRPGRWPEPEAPAWHAAPPLQTHGGWRPLGGGKGRGGISLGQVPLPRCPRPLSPPPAAHPTARPLSPPPPPVAHPTARPLPVPAGRPPRSASSGSRRRCARTAPPAWTSACQPAEEEEAEQHAFPSLSATAVLAESRLTGAAGPGWRPARYCEVLRGATRRCPVTSLGAGQRPPGWLWQRWLGSWRARARWSVPPPVAHLLSRRLLLREELIHLFLAGLQGGGLPQLGSSSPAGADPQASHACQKDCQVLTACTGHHHSNVLLCLWEGGREGWTHLCLLERGVPVGQRAKHLRLQLLRQVHPCLLQGVQAV